MPFPTPEQCTAARNSLPNRLILPPPRSSTPTSIRKKRSSATNQERTKLRRQQANKSKGKREYKDVIRQFEEQFSQVLSTSTISDYLSPKFVYLDIQELSNYKLSLKRISTAEYKELEEVLAEQQIQYDRHPDSGSTTSELLILKAKEFQDKLLCYTRKEAPKFLNRQLDSFKKRYRIKERRRHREGASAQIDNKSQRRYERLYKNIDQILPIIQTNQAIIRR